MGDGTPSVTLGGSNNDYVKQGEITTYHVASQITGYENLWSLPFKGVAFGDPIITADDPGESVVFDTQISGYQLSSTLFDWYKDLILIDYNKHATIEWSEDDYALCNCPCADLYELIPPLSIGMGNYSYTLP